jgi:hypothetical protein
MTWKELNKLALERYPITEKEKTCWQESQRRNELREAYKKRMSDQKGTDKVCGDVQTSDEQV